MTEHPIIFTGPMVLAILADLKTQTRRVIVPQPTKGVVTEKYRPGEHLWVKETTHMLPCGTGVYSIDSVNVLERRPEYSFLDTDLARWWYSKRVCPSIFMPRWASRLTLEITEVRVQRVQDISNGDAIAEGAYVGEATICKTERGPHPREGFEALWDSLNAKRGRRFGECGFGWDVNPWVWALTFRRIN